MICLFTFTVTSTLIKVQNQMLNCKETSTATLVFLSSLKKNTSQKLYVRCLTYTCNSLSGNRQSVPKTVLIKNVQVAQLYTDQRLIVNIQPLAMVRPFENHFACQRGTKYVWSQMFLKLMSSSEISVNSQKWDISYAAPYRDWGCTLKSSMLKITFRQSRCPR